MNNTLLWKHLLIQTQPTTLILIVYDLMLYSKIVFNLKIFPHKYQNKHFKNKQFVSACEICFPSHVLVFCFKLLLFSYICICNFASYYMIWPTLGLSVVGVYPSQAWNIFSRNVHTSVLPIVRTCQTAFVCADYDDWTQFSMFRTKKKRTKIKIWTCIKIPFKK